MVKSMFAGVAGLKAHQAKMDVIGNNIANVNTWGFKSYSYNFMDSIYSTSINSSAGATTAGALGGRNPSQVGYGSQIASISFQYTSGAPAPSENELDCMIDGTGLFLVGGMINGGITDVKGSGLYLSRVGMFSPDNNGYIVDSQKNYVYGYAVKQGTGIPEVVAQPWVYEADRTDVTVTSNITEDTPKPDYANQIEILGISVGTNKTRLDEQIQDWVKGVARIAADAAHPDNAKAKLMVDNYSISTEAVYTNAKQVTLSFTAKLPGVAPFEDAGGAAKKPDPPHGDATIRSEGIDGVDAIPAEFEETLSPLQIPDDPYEFQQYSIQSWSVSELGVITGVDIKNRPIVIGQIALVAVENPNGLVKTSGYYFTVGDNAGDVAAMAPDGGQVGSIRSKFLEMPNTDLANEFSNMITTQRGFQANSKIITVTDEMLQELVNMKR